MHRIQVVPVIALTALFCTGTACRTVEPDTVIIERIPPEVRDEISLQIERYFDGVPVSGVPLLDLRIDWNKENNWPDEFSFNGHEFRASYGTFGSDWFGGPDSRAALKSERGHSIKHAVTFPEPPWRHSFSCYWSSYGVVKEKGVIWGHETVYLLQFYPDGKLHMFTRQQPKGVRIDVYDRAQRKIGSNEKYYRYTWRGREITREQFHEELAEIWRKDFPPGD